MTVRILTGDCIDVMRTLPNESIDAIVTDPPYGLAFMGKEWDDFKAGDSPMRRSAELDAVNAGASRQGGRQRAGADYLKRQCRDMQAFQAHVTRWGLEMERILKPGGHLLAFGGTRTYHRLASGLEDAGFEIRDSLIWCYGSGFPKSLQPYRVRLSALCRQPEIASLAVQVSEWLPAPSLGAKDTTALALVEILPAGDLGVAIRTGAADGSSAVTVTSLSDWTTGRMNWNTASSCRGLSDASWASESTSIIETVSSTTIDPRTLSFFQSTRTLPSTTEAACRASGCRCRVVSVASRSSDGSWNFSPTPMRLAAERATSPLAPLKGTGSALKPSFEPIVLARKRLAGTVAATVAKFGTGALNVDSGRVGTDAGWNYPNGRGGEGWHGRESLSENLTEPMQAQAGRWPPNLLLSHAPDCVEGGKCAEDCAVAEMDRQSGELTSGAMRAGTTRSDDTRINRNAYGDFGGTATLRDIQGDSGGASRFFPVFRYEAKPSRAEREAGLREARRTDGRVTEHEVPNLRTSPRANHHPTVKPIALMAWLVQLVTPKGGTVLDPFLGSGTTAIACQRLGLDCIGIEKEAEYVEIARARVQGDSPLFGNVVTEP